MQILRKHNTDKATAIKRINAFFDGITRRKFPHSVRVIRPHKEWVDSEHDESSECKFSFFAKKGHFITVKVEGNIVVTDDVIIISSEIPGIAGKFVTDDFIIKYIDDEILRLFA